MRPEDLPADADTPRDALLEAAFAQFMQQAQAPPDFAARVRARVARLPAEGRPRSWRRRITAWLTGAAEPWDRTEADRPAAGWALPHPHRGWTVVLATGLVLSLLGNVWLGVQRAGPGSGGDPTPRGASPGPVGRVQLAFADDAREQDIRTLLLSLRATILAGPSLEGVYLVQVPLDWLTPRLRGTPNAPHTAEAMGRLLEALRAHPAVRLAEPGAAS